jgi:hypothetical protein
MPVFVMKWGDNDISFAATATKAEASIALDELGDPSEMERVTGRLGKDFAINLRYDPQSNQIIVPRGEQFTWISEFLRAEFPQAYAGDDALMRAEAEHEDRAERLQPDDAGQNQ